MTTAKQALEAQLATAPEGELKEKVTAIASSQMLGEITNAESDYSGGALSKLTKDVMALIAGKSVISCDSNHYYTFDGANITKHANG